MTGCHIEFISEFTDPGYSSSCYDVEHLYTVYINNEVGIWLIEDGYQMIRMIAEPIQDYSNIPDLVIKYDDVIETLKAKYIEGLVKEMEVRLYASGDLHIYINKNKETIVIDEKEEIPSEEEYNTDGE